MTVRASKKQQNNELNNVVNSLPELEKKFVSAKKAKKRLPRELFFDALNMANNSQFNTVIKNNTVTVLTSFGKRFNLV